MELRPYQQAAVDAVYNHLRSKDSNPCIVLPTGTGKSVVIAKIVSDAVSRVLILAHVKELLEQIERSRKRIAKCLNLLEAVHGELEFVFEQNPDWNPVRQTLQKEQFQIKIDPFGAKKIKSINHERSIHMGCGLQNRKIKKIRQEAQEHMTLMLKTEKELANED